MLTLSTLHIAYVVYGNGRQESPTFINLSHVLSACTYNRRISPCFRGNKWYDAKRSCGRLAVIPYSLQMFNEVLQTEQT